MMPKRLLLITRTFPYGLSESFIAGELVYLAKAFDEVVILPFAIKTKDRRQVPSNVRVAPPVRRGSKSNFYLSRLCRPRTIGRLIVEALKQLKHDSVDRAFVTRMAMLCCQRLALETNSTVRSIADNPAGYVAYSFWGNPGGYAMPFLASRGVPCCVRYHGGDLYWRGECLPWRDEIAECSSYTVFAAAVSKGYFEEVVPVSAAVAVRFKVCRLGVPAIATNPAATDPTVIVLVSCSSIYPLKRVHLIARFAKALAKYRRVEWHHFGGGEYDQMNDELARPADGLSVHMHGHVPGCEVISFFERHHVDLFVNMSTSEGTPVSIMEAISFAIPVLATDVGGTCESVIDGRSGMLIPADAAEDSEALAARVFAELQNGGGIARATPQAVWKERYDADANYTAFATILADLSHG